ncbi:hypothetical protein M5224_001812 [Vibrio parahaemolyticus]|jgi:predicted DNA-binding protein|uniref:Ribbon-helix-helix protein CopG domain-containing protein n=1 Tax=Vibrio parahaemolyticus TaxID=670 RepID=A0AAW3J1M4_VIBPH|nr:hypothetical protein [Vibrio parahaemolyticus]EGQ8007781.1 hypothetical protein [Vibrio parahaemolyticus]EHK2868620.1 hypothetical protein [Vibrio parahaemolyticus]EHK2870638.1 hypothetical protein [Vibrio parahaemolyticus]EHK9097377.1 hypothetical protein [Vibrio parahaemolyticus]EJE8565202.1 hypothetical protein [Vibrio parahaemolyticus]
MSDLTSKTYGVRFSAEVEALIQRESDRTGQTKTEVIRSATAKQLKQEPIELTIKQLELRLLRKSFEMNCAIVGLTDKQKKQAATTSNKAFGQEVLL